MKKFLYHYLVLIIAALECILSIGIIVAIYDFIILEKYDQILFFSIIMSIPLLLLNGIDFWIRKIDYFWMFLGCFLLSPIRVFGQLYTVVKLHMLVSQGETDFGVRGDYYYNFSDAFCYILFSDCHPFAKFENGQRTIKLSKRQKAKQEKRQQVWNEIQQNMQNRIYAIKNNKGNLTRPNVVLIPLLYFDNKISYFGKYDGERSSYYYNNGPKQIEQVAHITKLEINGVEYLRYPNTKLFSPTGLYLKPGTYTIKIAYQLKIAPPIFGDNFSHCTYNKSTSKTIRVNSYDENIYLGLICDLRFSWTEVRNSYSGQKVEDRDSSWYMEWAFKQYSFGEMNSMVGRIDKEWYKKFFSIDQ